MGKNISGTIYKFAYDMKIGELKARKITGYRWYWTDSKSGTGEFNSEQCMVMYIGRANQGSRYSMNGQAKNNIETPGTVPWNPEGCSIGI